MPLVYGEGDKAIQRLREEIQKAKRFAPESHTHWTVPRNPNKLFTGREDIMDELGSTINQVLNSPPTVEQCCIVISGLGGLGKSEICLQLAQKYRRDFWGVF